MPVALIVMVHVPGVAVAPTEIVIVDPKVGVPLAGEKLTVTFSGTPVAVRVTVLS